MLELGRLTGETSRAHHGFMLYWRGGPKRSLRAVTEQLEAEIRGSGMRLVSEDDKAPKRPQKSGLVGRWSRRFQWVERAKALDDEMARYVALHAQGQVEAVAKRQQSASDLVMENIMVPQVAFAKLGANTKNDFQDAKTWRLYQACLAGAAVLPRIFAAQRVARGVIVTPPGVIAGTNPQPALWSIQVYQPERKEPLPTTNLATQTSDEWEDQIWD